MEAQKEGVRRRGTVRCRGCERWGERSATTRACGRRQEVIIVRYVGGVRRSCPSRARESIACFATAERWDGRRCNG
jgi:hypothetical protein